MNFPCHRPAALGLALLASVPLSALAQAVAVATVPPVVVTATRIAQDPARVLGDVRVIGAEEIRAAEGALSLPELLQARAGVEIAANGGPGQLASVFLRGTNANHVVVLVDGVRVSSATAGTTALQQLPLNQIERIEVLRGPASSLYGADALGGVIQVFTRQGERSTARVALGSDRTREVSAGLGRRLGAATLSLDAGWQESDAFSATNAAIDVPGTPAAFAQFNPDRDGHRSRNLGVGLSHPWAAGHTLAVRGWVSDADTHYDAGASDDVLHQRLSGLSLESRNRLGERWHSLLRLARGTDDFRTSGGAFPSRFRTDQDQLTWQNDITLPLGVLAAGLEWRRESVDSDTLYSQTRRTVRSAFGSWAADLDAHRLEASLRHDDSSQFGGRDTGRLGYGYRIAPAWRLSAAAGTAFKAPTFNDLYYQSPFFFGNPALRPERSRNVEAALRHDSGALRGGLTLFRNRVRDLVAIDPVTFSTVINVNRATVRGATLDAGYTAARWRARAEWTAQDPEDADTGRRLPRRARHFGSASLDWTPGPWQAGVEFVASGERFDRLSNDPATRMGGYGLVHLRAAYALAPGLSLSARVNNVADKDHTLVQGYNTPGRQFFVALEYAAK